MVVAGMRDELCLSAQWDKLGLVCGGFGNLQSCNDWMGVREAGK